MVIICDTCKSENVVKKGFRHNKNSKKQKYFCHDFFVGMRFSPETIARAVHQHVDGFSLFKTQYHLFQHDNVKVTRWTISLWTKKYSDFLKSASSRNKTKA